MRTERARTRGSAGGGVPRGSPQRALTFTAAARVVSKEHSEVLSTMEATLLPPAGKAADPYACIGTKNAQVEPGGAESKVSRLEIFAGQLGQQ